MSDEVQVQKVEVSFVGVPPVKQIERASGVSGVRADGPVVRCLVCGSFQPFLEALRGHEVVNLTSMAHRRQGHPKGRTAIDLSASDSGAGKPSVEESRE